MFRARRSVEAQLITKAARRGGSAHRDPSAIEIALSLAAFITVAALGFFLATAFGG